MSDVQISDTGGSHAAAAERLAIRDATIGYDGRVVSHGLDIRIRAGVFTAIVGPNACGKSTMLRALGRLLAPSAGEVLLDGTDIRAQSPKAVARVLGLLPQSPIAPDGITVEELVSRGRHPHQGLLRQWSRADEQAVTEALRATGVNELATRQFDELSGGQRQRVWIAMVLAQQTPMMLLDEPTTFLDIAHQVDVLELCHDLKISGRTIVAVLHDLNQAARYADELIVMHNGAIAAQGAPHDVVTADLIQNVFGLPCIVIADPVTGTPLVVPARRSRRTTPG